MDNLTAEFERKQRIIELRLIRKLLEDNQPGLATELINKMIKELELKRS